MQIEFIKNGKFDVPKKEWDHINRNFSKEDIKYRIIEEMMIKDIPLPYRDITKKEAEEDFSKLLKVKKDDVIVTSKWHTRYDYEWKMSDTLIRSITTGNKSSDFFHQTERWKTNSINSPSPERTWNSVKFLNTLLNGLWTLKVESLTSESMRTLIALRKYIASQFRPSAAKVLYDHFQAKNILDFSSGWGDRLNGFLASGSTVSYYGVDPNEKLQKGYRGQIESFNRGMKFVTTEVAQAENIDYSRKFDFIFTSPPYYDIERYTYEDSQSWVRFKKFEDWTSGFLFKSIENAWKCLESGGHMVINISDVYCHHRVNKICDPMNNFIDKFEDSEYVSCWGLEMKKRPNSKSSKKGTFAEPVWIWKKS
jgi:hypothetical protein